MQETSEKTQNQKATSDALVDLHQSALDGVFWTTFERWAGKGIAAISFFILARRLDPADFGIVALASLCIAFLDIFVSQGLGFAIIQRKQVHEEHLDTAFWVNLALAGVATITIAATAGWVAYFFREPKLVPVLRWMSLYAILGGMNRIQIAVATRKLRFRVLAIRSFIANIVSGTTGIVLALLGFGVWSLVWQLLVGALVAVITLWTVSGWTPGIKISRSAFRELYGYGVKVSGDSFILFFSRRLDDLLIGALLGSATLGFYTTAKRLVTVVVELFSGAIPNVTLAALSRAQDDPAKMLRGLHKVTRVTYMVMVPVLLGMATLSRECIVMMCGEKWAQGAPALTMLLVGSLAQFITLYSQCTLHALGSAGVPLALNAARSILGLITMTMMVPFGITGVAGASSIRDIIMSWFDIAALRGRLKDFTIRDYLKQFIPAIAASIPMIICVKLAMIILVDMMPSYISAGLAILIGASMYIACVWTFIPTGAIELKCLLIQLLTRNRGRLATSIPTER